jgi:hypothetical protein
MRVDDFKDREENKEKIDRTPPGFTNHIKLNV